MAGAPFGVVDPGDESSPKHSVLEDLRAELNAETDEDLVIFDVPARPGYGVRCSIRFSYDEYAGWTKKSADKSKLNGVNLLRLGSMVLANTCRGLVHNGEPVTEPNGADIDFSSRVLWERLSTDDSPVLSSFDAIQRFYGYDAHVIQTGTAIVQRAGYGDEITEAEANPTRR